MPASGLRLASSNKDIAYGFSNKDIAYSFTCKDIAYGFISNGFAFQIRQERSPLVLAGIQ
jgi:hypothetical protein